MTRSMRRWGGLRGWDGMMLTCFAKQYVPSVEAVVELHGGIPDDAETTVNTEEDSVGMRTAR